MNRILALVVLAFSLQHAAPAVAAEPPSESICTIPEAERPPVVEPIEVCGKTVIRGDGGSGVLISIPRDVHLPRQECGGFGTFPCNLNTHGTAGALTGIVLSEDRPDPQEGRIVVLGRFSSEYGGLWTYLGWAMNFAEIGCGACSIPYEGLTIPAGVYRLHVIAEAPNAQMTLTLPGLEGEVTIEPPSDDYIQFEHIDSTYTLDQSQEVVYAGGATLELHVPGLTILSHKIDGTFTGRSGICMYHGDPGGPEEAAYLPYCPLRGSSGIGGPGAFSTDAPTLAFDGTSREQSLWERDAGSYGVGAWNAVAGTIDSVRVLGVAVQL